MSREPGTTLFREGDDEFNILAAKYEVARILNGKLCDTLREIEELATDTPDEATMEGALDAIKSCCEGALANG